MVHKGSSGADTVGAILAAEDSLRRCFPTYLALLLPLLSGCWKLDANRLEIESVDFAPTLEAAPTGWVIEPYKLPVSCPDGEDADMYALYDATASGPQPTAVFFHSGAFDYVISPQAADPIAGNNYASPALRLQREWAVRRAFMVIGMFADNDAQEVHTGALPVALAEAGVAMIVPTNCWGDHWANDSRTAERQNDSSEYFNREGYQAAEFAWDVASGASGTGISLGFQVDTSELYMVGQGEGGRAVTELLRDDYVPDGVLLDSVADDMKPYWETGSMFTERVVGFDRIWPDGDTSTEDGALGWATNAQLPDRIAYVYSTLDSRVPRASHEQAITRMNSMGADAFVHDIAQSRHVATGGDIVLARDAVTHMIGD